MKSALLVSKSTQTHLFDEAKRRQPATVLICENCYVVDLKSKEANGYDSVRLTYGVAKHIDKPTLGLLQKNKIPTVPVHVKEVRIKDTLPEAYVSGALLNPSLVFKVGDQVQVTGVSKAKGFQGGVKRHNFAGGPKTHGQSDRWRAPGSVGQTTTPGRTFKGMRMAGRMGGVKTTVTNLKVLAVDEKSLTVSGLVPGVRGGMIVVSHA